MPIFLIEFQLFMYILGSTILFSCNRLFLYSEADHKHLSKVIINLKVI